MRPQPSREQHVQQHQDDIERRLKYDKQQNEDNEDDDARYRYLVLITSTLLVVILDFVDVSVALSVF